MSIPETHAALDQHVPFDDLRARTQGTVAVPGDEGYDS